MQQVTYSTRDELKAQQLVKKVVNLVNSANELLDNPISIIEIYTDAKSIYSGVKMMPIIGKRNTTILMVELEMTEKEKMYFLQLMTERSEIISIEGTDSKVIKLEWEAA